MGERLRPLWYSLCVRQCVVTLCRVKSMDSVGEGLGIKCLFVFLYLFFSAGWCF